MFFLVLFFLLSFDNGCKLREDQFAPVTYVTGKNSICADCGPRAWPKVQLDNLVDLLE
jgi:hypothetical protein